MLKRFYPKKFVKDVRSIDYDTLLKKGYNVLLFDLDNTIAPFDIPEPTDVDIEFFKSLVNKGFKICLVSNNKPDRVHKFNEKLALAVVPKAGKPKSSGILKAIKLIDGNIDNTVLVGDQLFTDVWVGNRLGLFTILVEPIANRDEFTVKLKRGIEKLVFNQYLKSKRKK